MKVKLNFFLKNSFLILIIFLIFMNFSCNKKSTEILDSKNSSFDSDSEDFVDIDLTKMSSTMIYAEVFRMMIEPETFEGKRIRISGKFMDFRDVPESEYAVLVPDATACCEQGIGFKYDFKTLPEVNSIITVTGIFTITYDKNDLMRTFLICDNVDF